MKDSKSRASFDPEEERALWREAAAGDEGAREALILAYRPMVFWLAKKFRVPYSSYPDLVQEGMVGLISAVDHFDVARNNRFITYAYYRVKGRMANFLQRSEARAPLPVEDEYLERAESFEDGLLDRQMASCDRGRFQPPSRTGETDRPLPGRGGEEGRRCGERTGCRRQPYIQAPA